MGGIRVQAGLQSYAIFIDIQFAEDQFNSLFQRGQLNVGA